MQRIATVCALLAAAVSIGLSAQLRCETDERIGNAYKQIIRVDAERRASDEALQKQLDEIAPLDSWPWWCLDGTAGCFRSPDECAARRGSSLCKPVRTAYCGLASHTCVASLDACRAIEGARGRCVGVQ